MSVSEITRGGRARGLGATLAPDQLAQLSPLVAVPRYALESVEIGVVHFGPGAFHRAHQACYFDRALMDDPRWAICAVSLRTPDVRDALLDQEGLYTVVELERDTHYRVIGALRERLVAAESPQRVLARMAAPETKIVTLTVTEKGYCLDGRGELDRDHPDIRADLAHPGTPRSVIGYLVEGLRLRRAAGLKPFTTISCDNLADNGRRLGAAVAALARARGDEDLATWIARVAAFPRTMVDSIVPATDDALRERVSQVLGARDAWPVQREAFSQWVIEDRFSNDTPDWAALGVQITDDVAGFASAKLRLLNGAHSTLAYVGLLAGHATVAQAMNDDVIAGFARRMMSTDIASTLKAPRGLNIDEYIDTIAKRFRNPAMRHELAQIAWDGSQKLPVRLLGTCADRLAAGQPIDRLALPVAAWLHFVRRKALAQATITDPLANVLLAIGAECVNRSAEDVPRFLALDHVFPPTLAREPRFIAALNRAYDALATIDAPDATRVGAILAPFA